MTDLAAAMVLAAGRGERMRPLSDAIPKPALPLPGGPVVRFALEQVVACGVPRATVNAWHLAEAMISAARAAAPDGLRIDVSDEPRLLGGAGGIAAARDRGLLGHDGPVLVVNGDSILRLDLSSVLERARNSDDLVTLALIPHLEPRRWARVALDTDGIVTGFLGPGEPAVGEVPLLFPGAMVLSREAVDRLPSGVGEIMPRLWQPALDAGRLGGVVVAGHWREVGTPEDYLQAALIRTGGEPLVDRRATIDSSARLGSAWIGRDAVIEPDTVVGESVVAHGARVRSGARVFHSVLLGAVEAAPGEVLTNVHRAATVGR